MPTDARSEILARIRAAVPLTTPSNEWADIPRNYRRVSTAPDAEVLHLLKDRLHDYDAQVLDITEAPQTTLTEAIAQMLRARGLARILIPPGLPERLLPTGFDFVLDTGLPSAELNRCDGILTQSTLAIAETGTIVLQNVPGQGRRAATLVPDYHLCLVDAANVVATVPEAIAQLQATATLPTTFISGPSATADIEMTRIKGVHGPRFLDVILFSR
jgi:L-lactate dehydrogenase complex protein LldG